MRSHFCLSTLALGLLSLSAVGRNVITVGSGISIVRLSTKTGEVQSTMRLMSFSSSPIVLPNWRMESNKDLMRRICFVSRWNQCHHAAHGRVASQRNAQVGGTL